MAGFSRNRAQAESQPYDPAGFSQLSNLMMQRLASLPTYTPESLQQYVPQPTGFTNLPQQMLDEGGMPLSQQKALVEQMLALGNAGAAGALHSLGQRTPPGMASGNPYAQASQGTTPQSILQRAAAGNQMGFNQAWQDFYGRSYDQRLQAYQTQAGIDQSRASANASYGQTLASMLGAVANAASPYTSALASLHRPNPVSYKVPSTIPSGFRYSNISGHASANR